MSNFQPGSSVATSLSEGETLPKHCFKLQVWKKNFCLNKIPLTTVRPFIFKDVSLIDADIQGDKAMYQFLQYHVDEMIERAGQARDANPNSPELPLIRLRYEYSSSTIPVNSAKFGTEYLARVANPRDLLLACKKKDYSTDSKSADSKVIASTSAQEGEGKMRSPGALAVDIMKGDGKETRILLESSLAVAAEDYVEKLENDSCAEYIAYAMEQCEKYLRKASAPGEDLQEKLRVRKALLSRSEAAAEDVLAARKRWEKCRRDRESRFVSLIRYKLARATVENKNRNKSVLSII